MKALENNQHNRGVVSHASFTKTIFLMSAWGNWEQPENGYLTKLETEVRIQGYQNGWDFRGKILEVEIADKFKKP